MPPRSSNPTTTTGGSSSAQTTPRQPSSQTTGKRPPASPRTSKRPLSKAEKKKKELYEKEAADRMAALDIEIARVNAERQRDREAEAERQRQENMSVTVDPIANYARTDVRSIIERSFPSLYPPPPPPPPPLPPPVVVVEQPVEPKKEEKLPRSRGGRTTTAATTAASSSSSAKKSAVTATKPSTSEKKTNDTNVASSSVPVTGSGSGTSSKPGTPSTATGSRGKTEAPKRNGTRGVGSKGRVEEVKEIELPPPPPPPPPPPKTQTELAMEQITTGVQQRRDAALAAESRVMAAFATVAAHDHDHDHHLRDHGIMGHVDVPRDRSILSSTMDHQLMNQHTLVDLSHIMHNNHQQQIRHTLPHLPRVVTAAAANRQMTEHARARQATLLKAKRGDRASPSMVRALASSSLSAATATAAGGSPSSSSNDNNGLTISLQGVTREASERQRNIQAAAARRAIQLKSMMPGAALDENKRVYKRMNHRLHFLPNPRYVGIQSAVDLNQAVGHRDMVISQPNMAHPDASASHDPDLFFAAYPAAADFDNYITGEVYETTIAIRNISSLSRRFRVIPPATPYFLVRLPSFGNGAADSGLVAAGMSVSLHIRFAPDSLADYQDSLSIITEGGTLLIPLLARRHPPALSLPRVLHCGVCIVNGSVTVRFPFTNGGNDGRFWLVADPQDDDDEEEHDGMSLPPQQRQWTKHDIQQLVSQPVSQSSQSLDIGPFSISPSSFQLSSGGSMSLSVTFHPGRDHELAREHCRRFTIVCDNTQALSFHVYGDAWDAQLELTHIGDTPVTRISRDPDAKQHPPRPFAISVTRDGHDDDDTDANTNNDSSSEHKVDLIMFPDTPMAGNCDRSLSIGNPTPLPLSYRWVMKSLPDWFTPDTKSSSATSSSPPPDPNDRGVSPSPRGGNGIASEDDAVFEIFPPSGVLAPGHRTSFEIAFNPVQPGLYRRQAMLLVHQLPSQDGQPMASNEFDTPSSSVAVASESDHSSDAKHISPPSDDGISSHRSIGLFDDEDMSASDDDNDDGTSRSARGVGGVSVPPVHALAVAARESRTVVPVAGAARDTNLAPHHSVKYDREVSFMDFTLQGRGLGVSASLEPPLLLLGQYLSAGIEYTGRVLLRNHSNGMTHFEFGTPQPLGVLSRTRRPTTAAGSNNGGARPMTGTTSLSVQSVDGDGTVIPSSAASSVPLSQLYNISAPYDITVTPSQGTLNAGETRELQVRLKCHGIGGVDAEIACSLAHGTPLHLRVQARVAAKSLRIREPQIEFGYLNFGMAGVHKTMTITLDNDSDTPVPFAMCQASYTPPPFMDVNMIHTAIASTIVAPQGSPTASSSTSSPSVISFTPDRGVIPAGASLTIACTYRPLSADRLRTHIECHVPYVSPLYIRTTGDVQVPKVSLAPTSIILDHEPPPPPPPPTIAPLVLVDTPPPPPVVVAPPPPPTPVVDPPAAAPTKRGAKKATATTPAKLSSTTTPATTAKPKSASRTSVPRTAAARAAAEKAAAQAAEEKAAADAAAAIAAKVAADAIEAANKRAAEEKLAAERAAALAAIPPPPPPLRPFVFVGIPRMIELKLKNFTDLHTTYTFDRVDEPNHFKCEFMPATGVLLPRTEITVMARLTVRRAGPFRTVLGCDIEGVSLPLAFEIKAMVSDLVVSYHVPTNTKDASSSSSSATTIATTPRGTTTVASSTSLSSSDVKSGGSMASSQSLPPPRVQPGMTALAGMLPAPSYHRATAGAGVATVASSEDVTEDSNTSASPSPPLLSHDRDKQQEKILASRLTSLDKLYPPPSGYLIPYVMTSPTATTRGVDSLTVPGVPQLSTQATNITPVLPSLDFGTDCPIFGRRYIDLVIRNHTGIATTFDLTFGRLGVSRTVTNDLHAALAQALAMTAATEHTHSEALQSTTTSAALQLSINRAAMIASGNFSNSLNGTNSSNASQMNNGTKSRAFRAHTRQRTVSTDFGGSTAGGRSGWMASIARGLPGSTTTSAAPSEVGSLVDGHTRDEKTTKKKKILKRGEGKVATTSAVKSKVAAPLLLRSLLSNTSNLTPGGTAATTSKGTIGTRGIGSSAGASSEPAPTTVTATYTSAGGQQYLESESRQQLERQCLTKGQGVAFIAYPSSGTLAAYEAVHVQLVCFNDICGEFYDVLTCAIQGQPSTQMRVHVSVTGSPLQLSHDTPGVQFGPTSLIRMTQPDRDQIRSEIDPLVQWPKLVWSPSPARSWPTHRQVKINNAGPMDIRLRWLFFDYRTADPLRLVTLSFDMKKDAVATRIEPYRPPRAGDDFPFTVSAPELIVPARGHAHCTVSFDASMIDAGEYGGYLQAEVMLHDDDAARINGTAPASLSTLAVEEVKVSVATRGLTSSHGGRRNNRPLTGAAAMAEVISDIDAFESRLKHIAMTPRARELGGESGNGNDGSMTGRTSVTTSAAAGVLPTETKRTSLFAEPNWVVAPSSLSRHPLRLFVSATAVQSQLTIDRKPDADGSRAIRYLVSPADVLSLKPLYRSGGGMHTARQLSVAASTARLTSMTSRTTVRTVTAIDEQAATVASSLCIRALPLINMTATPLAFTVTAEPHEWFTIESRSTSRLVPTVAAATALSVSNVDTALSRSLTGQGSALKESIVLEGKDHVTLQIRFTPPAPKSLRVWPPVAHHQLQGHVVISYANGTRQLVDLTATLVRPHVTIAPSSHTFDAIHVGTTNTRGTLQLRLTNPSAAVASWSMVHVPTPPPVATRAMDARALRDHTNPEFDDDAHAIDDPTAFIFDQLTGTLPPSAGTMPSVAAMPTPALSHGINFTTSSSSASASASRDMTSGSSSGSNGVISHGREASFINVSFRPQRPARYVCHFRIIVADGSQEGLGNSLDITLRGTGSLDESHDLTFAHH